MPPTSTANTCLDCQRPISRYATRCRRCSKLGNQYAAGRPPAAFDRSRAERTIARCAAAYHLTGTDLRSEWRGSVATLARYAAALLLRDQGVPGRQIALLFGRSVGRGAQLLQAAERHYEQRPAFRSTVDALRRTMESA